MNIGTTCDADVLEILESEVFKLQQQGTTILSFQAFKHLLQTQTFTPFPKHLPVSIEASDPILNASPETIAKKTYIAPERLKEERYKSLLAKHYETIKREVLHQEAVLNHLRAKEVVSLLDFQGYLAHFFRENFAPFFSQRAFSLGVEQLTAHSYITAGSRHGKSELVKRLIFGVLESGHSAIVLDPHGDLAEQVAHWEEFAKDPQKLVYFNPRAFGNDLECVPILNPLSPLKSALNRDSVVSGFIDTLTSVIDSKDAPTDRMKSILKACLYTFSYYSEEVTLYDLIDFLGTGEKAEFWKSQAQTLLKNQSLLETIYDFDKKEYQNTKTAIRDRLRVLLASDVLDACLIGQSSIDLAQAMNTGKVMVFNLQKGQLGRDSSNAFGRLLLASISAQAMQRSTENKDDRKPVFLFMDEGDNYMSDNVIEIYKETGKYGLFVTFIQQVAGYGMDSEQWRVVRGNSGLRFAGNVGGDSDGLKIVSEMVSTPKEDILSLPKGNFWVKSGTATPQKIRIGADLVDYRHSMTPQEWHTVKAYQQEQFYRVKNGKNAPIPHDSTPEASPTPNTTNKPQESQKNGKKAPLDFDLD